MAKLVVLSEGFTGRSHELKVDKTTVGRVEDNAFQIAEPSVSSHHCEILLRGGEVIVKDLDSTNGTFINGEKITESVLKPGQTLRLGQIELSLDDGSTPVPSASGSPVSAPGSKTAMSTTTAIQRGVSLGELEQGPRASGFDTASKAFSKKSNQTNRWFLIIGIVVGVILLGVFLYTLSQIKK
jgi:pSer/pThr/pTyr-binding forkhead associated (FHA) protein